MAHQLDQAPAGNAMFTMGFLRGSLPAKNIPKGMWLKTMCFDHGFHTGIYWILHHGFWMFTPWSIYYPIGYVGMFISYDPTLN